jgi:hypothetical protein
MQRPSTATGRPEASGYASPLMRSSSNRAISRPSPTRLVHGGQRRQPQTTALQSLHCQACLDRANHPMQRARSATIGQQGRRSVDRRAQDRHGRKGLCDPGPSANRAREYGSRTCPLPWATRIRTLGTAAQGPTLASALAMIVRSAADATRVLRTGADNDASAAPIPKRRILPIGRCAPHWTLRTVGRSGGPSAGAAYGALG